MGVDHVVSILYCAWLKATAAPCWYLPLLVISLLNQYCAVANRAGDISVVLKQNEWSWSYKWLLYVLENFLLRLCWRTDADKGSIFFLFVQFGVSVQSWHNQQRWMYCILFQKPFHGVLLELFFPREINRELMLFWTIAIDKIFLRYLSLWLLLTYTCIGDLVFIASSFQYVFSISKIIPWVFEILNLHEWMYFGAYLSRNVSVI